MTRVTIELIGASDLGVGEGWPELGAFLERRRVLDDRSTQLTLAFVRATASERGSAKATK